MTEPTTTTTNVALISAFGVSSVFPNLEIGTLIGSLCGATLLIINKQQLSKIKSLALFFSAFLIGLLFADFATQLISECLPRSLQAKVPQSLGALLVSILATQILQLLLNQNLETIIKILRGKV